MGGRTAARCITWVLRNKPSETKGPAGGRPRPFSTWPLNADETKQRRTYLESLELARYGLPVLDAFVQVVALHGGGGRRTSAAVRFLAGLHVPGVKDRRGERASRLKSKKKKKNNVRATAVDRGAAGLFAPVRTAAVVGSVHATRPQRPGRIAASHASKNGFGRSSVAGGRRRGRSQVSGRVRGSGHRRRRAPPETREDRHWGGLTRLDVLGRTLVRVLVADDLAGGDGHGMRSGLADWKRFERVRCGKTHTAH